MNRPRVQLLRAVLVSLMCAAPALAQSARPTSPLLPEIVRNSPRYGVGIPPLLAADGADRETDFAGINPFRVLAGANQALLGRPSPSSNSEPVWPASPGTGAGRPTESQPPGGLSAPINILVILTVVSLAPSLMLMTTCFVRIIIVLGLLRQALGTQTLPPPQVILGLALFMTLLVMAPTFERIHKEAIAPYHAGQIRDYDTLWDRTKQPVRDFMFDQIEATGNWSSVYMVLNYRGVDVSDPARLTTNDVDMVSLMPAFMLSELKTGFLIGFKVYLPFLVIDMVISALLISMGMMMLPPVLISLPFKLLLFVLVDGWQLVVGSLMQSFATHPDVPAASSHAVAPLAERAVKLAQLISSGHSAAFG